MRDLESARAHYKLEQFIPVGFSMPWLDDPMTVFAAMRQFIRGE